MLIKVDDMLDFKTFILDAINNEKSSIRVLFSSKKSGIGWNDDKKPLSSTFVLLTQLYTVVHEKTEDKDSDNTDLDTLIEFRDKQDFQFRIQKFKKIKIDSDNNCLKVSRELDVI